MSRVAAVTGAASGIGLAVARHLTEQGHRVAMLDCQGDAVRRAAFLCSEHAGFITGQLIGVNGGWYL